MPEALPMYRFVHTWASSVARFPIGVPVGALCGLGAFAATVDKCAEIEPADTHGSSSADSSRAAAITDAVRGELGDMRRPPPCLQIL